MFTRTVPDGTADETEPRTEEPAAPPEPDDEPEEVVAPRLWRRGVSWTANLLAAALILFALLLPIEIGSIRLGAFARIPVEALAGAALALVLPSRARRVVAALAGAGLGLLLIVKVLDAGFHEVLVRPFDPVLDWALLRPGVEFLASSAGMAGAVGIAAAIGVAALVLVIAMALASLRLSRLAVRHDRTTTSLVAVLVPTWIICAALGAHAVPGVPVASKGSVRLAYKHAIKARKTLMDKRAFAAVASVDAFRDTPGDRLLTALRGKDVVLAFVESYGRSAIEAAPMSTRVVPALDAGNRRLAEAGFSARSGFLTSSTAGGSSWLAHATLLSGLWINDQQRYRTLVSSDRLTLNRAFQRADWRSVGVMPGITRTWGEASFFGYDKLYTAQDLGYRGPSYNWVTMPDQFTLSAFRRLEHGRPGHAPMMVEMPLLSSHAGWARVPTKIEWDRVGDGSIFHSVPATNEDPKALLADPYKTRTEYGRSVAYSLDTLLSYVRRYGDDDLVLIFLGDHQPIPVITGRNAGRDVPISIVTRDRAVLDRISAWGWQDGVKPGPRAPVWPMSAFRDRFLTAFGPGG